MFSFILQYPTMFLRIFRYFKILYHALKTSELLEDFHSILRATESDVLTSNIGK